MAEPIDVKRAKQGDNETGAERDARAAPSPQTDHACGITQRAVDAVKRPLVDALVGVLFDRLPIAAAADAFQNAVHVECDKTIDDLRELLEASQHEERCERARADDLAERLSAMQRTRVGVIADRDRALLASARAAACCRQLESEIAALRSDKSREPK